MFFAGENSASLLNNGFKHVVSIRELIKIAKFMYNSLIFRLVCISGWRLSLSLSLSLSLDQYRMQ